jgi:hypothetical protein
MTGRLEKIVLLSLKFVDTIKLHPEKQEVNAERTLTNVGKWHEHIWGLVATELNFFPGVCFPFVFRDIHLLLNPTPTDPLHSHTPALHRGLMKTVQKAN